MNKTITVRLPIVKEHFRHLILLEMIKKHHDWDIHFEPFSALNAWVSVQIAPKDEIADGIVAKSCLIEVQKILHKNGINL